MHFVNSLTKRLSFVVQIVFIIVWRMKRKREGLGLFCVILGKWVEGVRIDIYDIVMTNDFFVLSEISSNFFRGSCAFQIFG